VERKKGWREKVGKVALVVVSFLPLVVAFAVPDFRIATTCAFGASVFDFALDFYRLKTGRTKVFPKVLNAVFLSLFGILTVLMWADTKRDTVYIVWDGKRVRIPRPCASALTFLSRLPPQVSSSWAP